MYKVIRADVTESCVSEEVIFRTHDEATAWEVLISKKRVAERVGDENYVFYITDRADNYIEPPYETWQILKVIKGAQHERAE